jgi:hypothetical protein
MGVDTMKSKVILNKILEELEMMGIIAVGRDTTFEFLDLSDTQYFILADALCEEFGVEYVDFDGLTTLGDLVDLLMKG